MQRILKRLSSTFFYYLQINFLQRRLDFLDESLFWNIFIGG